MTTLTATEMIVSGLALRPAPHRRQGGLRALLARMAAVARADTARRSLTGMPDHLLRDIGLTRAQIDVLDL